jgi:glycosyltransferase involved in cell wall biosynthesis
LARKPIKTLYVIATLDRAGAEKQMVQLATGLNRDRFEPEVVCLWRTGPLEKDLQDARIPVTLIRKKWKFDLSIIRRLADFIRERNFDIVHTWLFTANTTGRLAARKAGTPVIIASERCVDVWKTVFHRAVDRYLSKDTHRIIANAEAVKDFIQSEGVLPDKIDVISNSFDKEPFRKLDRAAARAALGISEEEIAAGFAGRLEPQKGVRYLIKAARALPEDVPWKILVFGEGAKRQKLESLVRSFQLGKRVRFMGTVENTASVFPGLDVFILPSLWEGLPNAVIEACASAVPVVATEVGGVKEIIRDGQSGFLVPPRDSKALAEKMTRLIQDEALRKRMGKAARDFVLAVFDVRTVVLAYQDLYRRAMERG